MVEKADSFHRTDVVVSPDTSSEALIADVSGDWLLDDDDEARDF